jgi:hypothetical protein
MAQNYVYGPDPCSNHRYPICGPPFFYLFNSSLLWDVFIINRLEEGFCISILEMGLYRSRIEFLVMFEVVQHCL